MPNESLILGLLFVLGSAIIGGLLAKKIKQPLVIGYLIAGIIVSPFLGKLNLPRDSFNFLAEVGLGLLMFTLGLEFSFDKIAKFKKIVITGAVLQMLSTILVGFGVLNIIFGIEIKSALIMAMAFSLSSTAIVVKILTSQNKLESLSGEILLGWLLIQDLAVLPMISLLPVMFGNEGTVLSILTILKAITLLAITWYSVQIVVPRLVKIIINQKSRELLIIFSVTLVFAFSFLASKVGFSFGLGAFLAGLILSHTDLQYAVFSEIRPLRDVFLAVFFVSLGLTLEPIFLMTNMVKIIIISVIFLLIKTLITGTIVSRFKFHAKTVLETSLGLSQVGEFAFVLGAVSLGFGFITKENYSIIVSVTLFTMMITPWIFNLSDKIYKYLVKKINKSGRFYENYFVRGDKNLFLDENQIENHVIIVGFGRVGKWVGSILEKSKIPYLVIEHDPSVVKHLKLEEKKVIFGDPTDIAVLEYAQASRAKLIIIAIPDSSTQKMVIENSREINKNIKIICRSHVEEEEIYLKSLGVNDIIHPELEAALSISQKALHYYEKI